MKHQNRYYDREKQGKRARQKGVTNQKRSVYYILNNYEKYKVPSRYMIENAKVGITFADFFSKVVGEKLVQRNNKYKLVPVKLGWDIIALGKEYLYLIQVKTIPKNRKADTELIERYKNEYKNSMPPYIKMELHFWTQLGDIEVYPIN